MTVNVNDVRLDIELKCNGERYHINPILNNDNRWRCAVRGFTRKNGAYQPAWSTPRKDTRQTQLAAIADTLHEILAMEIRRYKEEN